MNSITSKTPVKHQIAVQNCGIGFLFLNVSNSIYYAYMGTCSHIDIVDYVGSNTPKISLYMVVFTIY